MDITNNVFESLKSYYHSLSHFGYKKQSDVNKLLIYMFIEELLTDELRIYITEEDYKYIEKALTCLYGSSCLIPYNEYINDDSLFGVVWDGSCINPRISEDSQLRDTENMELRLKIPSYDE